MPSKTPPVRALVSLVVILAAISILYLQWDRVLKVAGELHLISEEKRTTDLPPTPEPTGETPFTPTLINCPFTNVKPAVLDANPVDYVLPGALPPGSHTVTFTDPKGASVFIAKVELYVCQQPGWILAGSQDPISIITDDCSGKTLQKNESCSVTFGTMSFTLKAELAPKDSGGGWLHSFHIAR